MTKRNTKAVTAEMDAPRLLAKKEVVERTTLNYFTIRAMVKAEQFPKPVQLSKRRIAWFFRDFYPPHRDGLWRMKNRKKWRFA